MKRHQTIHLWTPEHKDTLRVLWNGNKHSSSAIMDIMNKRFNIDLSRSAIIGMAHRMELMQKESLSKQSPLVDRYEFTRLYSSGLSYKEMMVAFHLKDEDQVKYRVKKFGLEPRSPRRVRRPHESVMVGTPRGADPRGLKRDDMGLPRQTYEMVNHGSQKWFATVTPCCAKPCDYEAVPTGALCYSHGGMM